MGIYEGSRGCESFYFVSQYQPSAPQSKLRGVVERRNRTSSADIKCSCVDSILINGKGSVYCPGQDFLVSHTSSFMKYALYPSRVNDKGQVLYINFCYYMIFKLASRLRANSVP